MAKTRNILLITILREEELVSLERASQKVFKYLVSITSSVKDALSLFERYGGYYDAVLIDQKLSKDEDLMALNAEAKDIKIPAFFCLVGSGSVSSFTRVRWGSNK